MMLNLHRLVSGDHVQSQGIVRTLVWRHSLHLNYDFIIIIMEWSGIAGH